MHEIFRMLRSMMLKTGLRENVGVLGAILARRVTESTVTQVLNPLLSTKNPMSVFAGFVPPGKDDSPTRRCDLPRRNLCVALGSQRSERVSWLVGRCLHNFVHFVSFFWVGNQHATMAWRLTAARKSGVRFF